MARLAKGIDDMKRTLALTTVLALASLGVAAYGQTAPADQTAQTQQTGKKHKKQHADKKEKKSKTTHSSEKTR